MAPLTGQHPIYLLPLKDDGSPDIPGKHDYIYLPPPTEPAYTLRFVIQGTSSICRQGVFNINVPAEGQAFNRKEFRQFKFVFHFALVHSSTWLTSSID